MLSAVYQLSTDYWCRISRRTPRTGWYWRADRHRMTAEQIRDSLLFVSGLAGRQDGRSINRAVAVVQPADRLRKVSRYKLDDYLQLFDFPSPNLSAERRFTTTVPLQRLFFMNSDFMQQQGELIARRVSEEANNTARIQKAYLLIFGRGASDAEIKAGLAFRTTEPLKRTKERRATKDTKDSKDAKDGTDKKGGPDTKKDLASGDEGDDGEKAGGHDGWRHPWRGEEGRPREDAPGDPLGRYVKILLSSSEFLFVD